MFNRVTIAICFLLLNSLAYSQNSDSASFYLKKGTEEKEARRFREAEKFFKIAIQFNPSDAESCLSLAEVLKLQNRYAESREQYLAANKLSADNPIAVENLATLSFNLRKWDDAILYAKKMQSLKIAKPASYIIGKSYYEQENYGEAIKALALAANEEPARADIPYTIGRAYLDMSNYKQSALQFEKAISLDSTRVNWIYEASLVFYAIPDYKKCLQYIQLAGAKGYKKNNDYYENLGNAYANVKQYPQAIESFKEVLKNKPSDQEILYQVAQAYFKSGKYQEAIDYWDQVFGADKTNARVLYMIGLSYQKKGEKQKGTDMCDKAIEMDPSLSSLKEQIGESSL